MNTEIIKM